MDFDKVIEKRKSVRSFTSKNVSWKQVIEALDSVIQGPATNNDLPLKFIIIEDPNKIERLAKASDQLWISEAPIIVAIVSDDLLLEKQFGDRGRVYSRQQSGAAIMTLLLKITDMNLSACWVGSYNDDDVRFILEVPNNMQVEAIIPIGYESNSPKNKSKARKRKIDTYLKWESFKNSRRPTMFKERQGIVNKDTLPV